MYDNEIKEENVGVYELNCKIAKALNLRHKPELDCKDTENFAHRHYWDQRSVNISYQSKTRIREVDFTRNHTLLLAYAAAYGIDLLCSGDKPKAIVSFKDCENKPEPLEITSETISEVLINAILAHCEVLKPTLPQNLIHDFEKLL